MGPCRGRWRTRARSRRGFSLMEMLAAVALIGIMAAFATPTFIEVMRDRRVNQAALQMADMYRSARTRAMDRGSAVMVRWNAAAKTLAVFEAVVSTNLVNGMPNVLPVSSCLGNDFNNAATTQRVAIFFPEDSLHALADVEMLGTNKNVAQTADICFTPRGRTYASFDGAPLAPLLGVPQLRVRNTLTGRDRFVMIPPTGGARVNL